MFFGNAFYKPPLPNCDSFREGSNSLVHSNQAIWFPFFRMHFCKLRLTKSTTLLSLYIVYRAASIGYPSSILFRMLLNILAESVVGVVPVLGDVFDFVWRSNQKNVNLLLAYSQTPRKVRRSTLLLNGLLLGGALLVLLGVLGFSLFILVRIVQVWMG